MNLKVKIQIRCTIKKKLLSSADGSTHSFVLSVQGLNGNKIEHFVKQVVFSLPFNSSNPKQVIRKPPYVISGSTHASFRLPIDLFLHTSENCNKVRYSYYLLMLDEPEENAVCVKTLTFLNCPKDFSERLLLGGAAVVSGKKKSKDDWTQVKCKSEPDEIIEIQEVVSNEKEYNDWSQVKCKSEPVEIIENEDVADSNIASKENVEHFVCKTEPIEDNNDQVEIHNQLPNTCVENNDAPEQNSSLVIQSVYSFDDLLKQNEILQEENETLNKKYKHQESLISTYVEKLPVLQNNSSTLSTELNQLKQKSEANESEISTLKSAIEKLVSEIRQHKNKLNKSGETTVRPDVPSILAQSKFVPS